MMSNVRYVRVFWALMFLAPAVAMGAGYYEDVGTGGLNSVKWDSSDVERVGYWPYGPPRRVLAEGGHVYVGMGGGYGYLM